MERRALLAAVLCLVVLVVYQEALQYFYPTQPGSSRSETAAPSPEVDSSAAVPPPPPAAVPEVAAVAGEVGTVGTDLFDVRIDTAGGRITSMQLKRFRSSMDAASGALEMIQVAPHAAPPLGVRLASEDGRMFEDDTQVSYAIDRKSVVVSGSDNARINLRGTLPSGVQIEKTLSFTGNAYPIGLEVRVVGAPPQLSRIGVAWRHHIEPAGHADQEAYYRGAVILTNDKVVRELATSIATQPPKSFEPPVGWVGYADHYFLAAVIAGEPATSRAMVSPENAGVQLMLTALRPPTEDAAARFSLYVGPKDVELLETIGFDLRRAVDFGWFSFLAIPLLRLLKLFHRVTGNYGVDIILLTILVKVLFIPLTNRSMKSMRDMQRLQPQMAKLREKFKDDREQLNKEMIELYRRHRVNPLGGCLPMLLQFPVFIGLYQALSQAFELRHANFALWVRDLSTHECYPWPGQTPTACNDFSVFGAPVPILVLLMGGSMILQQYLTPSTGMDPAQQRMMMVLMPIMFTVMFVNFPSGLVLYWLVNNVLTIGQQWWTNRPVA
jgi:YidC/Oxa1 family membrane protein insertase